MAQVEENAEQLRRAHITPNEVSALLLASPTFNHNHQNITGGTLCQSCKTNTIKWTCTKRGKGTLNLDTLSPSDTRQSRGIKRKFEDPEASSNGMQGAKISIKNHKSRM